MNTSTQEQQYGSVALKDHLVVRSGGPSLFYEIPIDDIKLIGEFTTAGGPWDDDWFLTIITKDTWYEMPMYATGVDELLVDLGEKLGVKLNYKLVGSTKWKTRIMFPEDAQDQQLYKLVDVEPRSLVYWVKKLFGLQKTERQFSEQTMSIFRGASTMH